MVYKTKQPYANIERKAPYQAKPSKFSQEGLAQTKQGLEIKRLNDEIDSYSEQFKDLKTIEEYEERYNKLPENIRKYYPQVEEVRKNAEENKVKYISEGKNAYQEEIKKEQNKLDRIKQRQTELQTKYDSYDSKKRKGKKESFKNQMRQYREEYDEQSYKVNYLNQYSGKINEGYNPRDVIRYANDYAEYRWNRHLGKREYKESQIKELTKGGMDPINASNYIRNTFDKPQTPYNWSGTIESDGKQTAQLIAGQNVDKTTYDKTIKDYSEKYWEDENKKIQQEKIDIQKQQPVTENLVTTKEGVITEAKYLNEVGGLNKDGNNGIYDRTTSGNNLGMEDGNNNNFFNNVRRGFTEEKSKQEEQKQVVKEYLGNVFQGFKDDKGKKVYLPEYNYITIETNSTTGKEFIRPATIDEQNWYNKREEALITDNTSGNQSWISRTGEKVNPFKYNEVDLKAMRDIGAIGISIPTGQYGLGVAGATSIAGEKGLLDWVEPAKRNISVYKMQGLTGELTQKEIQDYKKYGKWNEQTLKRLRALKGTKKAGYYSGLATDVLLEFAQFRAEHPYQTYAFGKVIKGASGLGKAGSSFISKVLKVSPLKAQAIGSATGKTISYGVKLGIDYSVYNQARSEGYNPDEALAKALGSHATIGALERIGKVDTFRPVRRASGLIENNFVIADKGELVPLRDRLRNAEDILINKEKNIVTITARRKLIGNKLTNAKEGSNDYTYNIPVNFGTTQTGKALPTSELFMKERGILKGEILGKAEIETAKIQTIPERLRNEIYNDLKKNTKTSENNIKELYELAQAEADATGEVIATLSPKRLRGFEQSELEIVKVYPKNYKSPLKFGGFTEKGQVVMKEGDTAHNILQKWSRIGDKSNKLDYFEQIAKEKAEYLKGKEVIAGEYKGHGKEHLLPMEKLGNYNINDWKIIANKIGYKKLSIKEQILGRTGSYNPKTNEIEKGLFAGKRTLIHEKIHQLDKSAKRIDEKFSEIKIDNNFIKQVEKDFINKNGKSELDFVKGLHGNKPNYQRELLAYFGGKYPEEIINPTTKTGLKLNEIFRGELRNTASKYYSWHDLTKSADVESFSKFPHGETMGALWRANKLPKEFYKLDKIEQTKLIDAFEGHEHARFNLKSLFQKPTAEGNKLTIPNEKQLYYYMKNKIKSNPYLEDVATLDRIDLKRFGIKPDELFMSKKALERIYGNNKIAKAEINKLKIEAEKINTELKTKSPEEIFQKKYYEDLKIEQSYITPYKLPYQTYGETYKNTSDYYKANYMNSPYATGKYTDYKLTEKEEYYNPVTKEYEMKYPYETYTPTGEYADYIAKYGDYTKYNPYVPTGKYSAYPTKPMPYARKSMPYKRNEKQKVQAWRPVMYDDDNNKIIGNWFNSQIEATNEGFIGTDESPANKFEIEKGFVARNEIRKGRESKYMKGKFIQRNQFYIEKPQYQKNTIPEKRYKGHMDLNPYIYNTN